jgi:hypothetical protein
LELAAPIADANDYRIRALGAVARDIAADRCKVATRGAGEAVSRQSAFAGRGSLAEQFGEGFFAVQEIAQIGRVDPLLDVGPQAFVKWIALRIVHPDRFATGRKRHFPLGKRRTESTRRVMRHDTFSTTPACFVRFDAKF